MTRVEPRCPGMAKMWHVAARGRCVLADGTVLACWFPPLADDRSPALRGFWADAFSEGFMSTSQINSRSAARADRRYNAIFAEVLAHHDRTGSGHARTGIRAFWPRDGHLGWH